jgi:hypothetical protein
MSFNKFKSSGLVIITILLLTFTISTGVISVEPETRYQVLDETIEPPDETVDLAQSTQSLDFTLGDWDYRIVTCSYSASHTNTYFKYRLSFTVSGGSLEFFICLQPEANLWANGYSIYIDTGDHWGSTDGVTVTRSFQSNVALAFVFNHESSGSRTVSGSVVVDSAGPAITTSLVQNATYNGTTTIEASATDSFGSVDSMEIYIDGSRKTSSNGGEIAYDWTTTGYSNGNHTISILAEDDSEHVTNHTYLVWVDNQGYSGLFSSSTLGIVGLVGVVVLCAYAYGRKYGFRKPSSGSYAPDIYIPE